MWTGLTQTEQFANADRRIRANADRTFAKANTFANADRTFVNAAFADRTFANAAFADRYSIVSVVQFSSPANDKRSVGECSVR